jgi:hypothetical protein
MRLAAAGGVVHSFYVQYPKIGRAGNDDPNPCVEFFGCLLDLC